MLKTWDTWWLVFIAGFTFVDALLLWDLILLVIVFLLCFFVVIFVCKFVITCYLRVWFEFVDWCRFVNEICRFLWVCFMVFGSCLGIWCLFLFLVGCTKMLCFCFTDVLCFNDTYFTSWVCLFDFCVRFAFCLF